MVPDVLHGEPLGRVSIQHLLDELLARFADDAGDEVVAVENLLVQLARVRVLERQVTARHRVQDDATRPDVGIQTVVPLPSDHLGSRVARRPTGRFQGLAVSVHV